jgi:hypothetical protein
MLIDITNGLDNLTVGMLVDPENEVVGYRADPANPDNPAVSISGPQDRTFASIALQVGTLRQFGREDRPALLTVTEETPYDGKLLSALRSHFRINGKSASGGVIRAARAAAAAEVPFETPLTTHPNGQADTRMRWLQAMTGARPFDGEQEHLQARIEWFQANHPELYQRTLNDLVSCACNGEYSEVMLILHGYVGDFTYARRDRNGSDAPADGGPSLDNLDELVAGWSAEQTGDPEA